MRKSSTMLAAFFAASLVLSGIAYSMDSEFYVNTYRSVGTVSARGQRSAGMGRTGAGIADGVSSVAINPAGLGAFTGYGVEGGVGFDWLDDGVDSANQASFRLGGALSLEAWHPSGGMNQTVGGLVATESFSGAGGVDMKRSQTSITGAYGAHVMEDLVVGVSASLFDGSFKAGSSPVPFDRNFTGGEFKVGGIYRISDQMTAGGVLGFSTGSYNEKAYYALDHGSGNLNRWNLRGGVGYQLSDETLLAGDLWYDRMKTEISNWIDESDSAWGLSAGIEQQVLPDVLALRGGLYYEHNSYSSNGIYSMLDTGKDYGKSRVGFTAGAAVRVYSLDVNTKGDIKNLLDISAEW